MMVDKINSLTIRTPEGIEFSLMLAGPVTRFLAWSVDLLVILATNKLLNVLLGVLGIISRDLAMAAGCSGVFYRFHRLWNRYRMVLARANPGQTAFASKSHGRARAAVAIQSNCDSKPACDLWTVCRFFIWSAVWPAL